MTPRHPPRRCLRQPCQRDVCDLCTFVYHPVCDSKPVATSQLFVAGRHQLVQINTATNQSLAITSSSMHRAYVRRRPCQKRSQQAGFRHDGDPGINDVTQFLLSAHIYIHIYRRGIRVWRNATGRRDINGTRGPPPVHVQAHLPLPL